MIIDSHQHFWALSRDGFAWPTSDLPVLFRNYLPEDYEPFLVDHGIEGTVLIQSAPNVEETRYLFTLADKYAWIKGVVGWLDFTAEDFSDQLDELARHPKLIGFRPMLQSLPDEWVLQDRVLQNLGTVQTQDLTIDLLITHNQLPAVLQMMKVHPTLHAVLDHFGKPDIKGHQYDPWMDQMKALSEYPNVHVKLSGLVTEADHHSWKPDDVQRYIEHVHACFGSERMMFGSDWPVCRLAASYEQVLTLATNGLKKLELTKEERQAIFHDNACRFYKL
ncbi:amidohydrolase family protein [Aureibacillus halotolerans]|uniref:L-fuconolactonase n=1 Tax=Aureibacillus halotolerans TaxID=1508390 RepID=A0A4V3D4J1_9BACI|nr:amidohydrolase family protein [Aureibacillus halotolerans]TDQ36437.1 L-fuconolactonase [Aureibacillus halotolerans]